MKINADMGKKRGPLWPLEYMVDKVVEIPNTLFANFMDQPLERYGFIEQNNVLPYHNDGIVHCLLVLCEGHTDGVLVKCDGYGAADLMSYQPNMRDTIQSKLDQAADHIIQQGAEHTASGYWCVYCEELEEQLGLTIHDGSGLDAMLKDTLERRPEVAAVNMVSGAVETTFHPEFCKGLRVSAEEKKPVIRVRDILPLLAEPDPSAHPEDPRKSFLTHPETGTRVWPEDLRELTAVGQTEYAGLLNAPVTEIVPTDEGIKVVLTDVAPEELARFNQDYEAHQAAEQAMGPTL